MKLENSEQYNQAIEYHNWLCLKPQYGGPKNMSGKRNHFLRQEAFSAIKEYEKRNTSNERHINI